MFAVMMDTVTLSKTLTTERRSPTGIANQKSTMTICFRPLFIHCFGAVLCLSRYVESINNRYVKQSCSLKKVMFVITQVS